MLARFITACENVGRISKVQSIHSCNRCGMSTYRCLLRQTAYVCRMRVMIIATTIRPPTTATVAHSIVQFMSSPSPPGKHNV